MDKAFTLVGNLVSNITSLGVKLIAVTVILQVLFGAAVPFLGLDVVGNIVKLVSALGSQGLVGLVAVAVLYWSFNKAQTLSLYKEKPANGGFFVGLKTGA